jgi:alkylation response protein AidB-like acyl-CoA dehydrogenase
MRCAWPERCRTARLARVDFSWSPDQIALRQAVREFLADDPAVPANPSEDTWLTGFDRAFSRRLGARGWIGLTWPVRYAGSERSYLDRLIVTEELLLAGAPVAAHWFGDRQIGPALLAHGSDAQKRELLPRIARGEITFCVGMSEPAAGSDLAALETRAELRGSEFVIRGQKTWTSFAESAEYCYLLARTDPAAPRHQGLSELLVPMDAPGIRVQPIRDMVGETHFGELFLDEVRVPASALIGTLHRGFYQIMGQLDYERGGIERLLSNAPLWHEALAHAREHDLLHDAALRQEIADVEIERRAGRALVYRVAALLSQGAAPSHEAAVAKAFCTALEQRMADLAARILGPYAQLLPGDPRAPLGGRAARSLLYAPAYTIQGGTSEILREIIARRGLGLP